MDRNLNLTKRKPIWIALSYFYLDTELQEVDFRYITIKIIESPYNFDEINTINKYQVFPVLQPNLLGVAGVWAGFNEEWLVKRIRESLSKRTLLKKIAIESACLTFKWMCRDYWEQLEKVYHKIKFYPSSLNK